MVRYGTIAMNIRNGLCAAVLLLGLATPAAGNSSAAPHVEAVRLDARQVEAGKFAIADVRAGTIGTTITVPGTIAPDGDRIARVAVRLLGTVAELRKRLGDPVKAGEVVAVIESREVADAKSDYLAARLTFNLQQTLFDRSKSLFESKVMSENAYLRERTTYEDARIKMEAARQKLFALGLTADQIEELPQQPVESLRRQELRAPIDGRIAERRVELGSLVGREGQESELYVIVDPRVVWVELSVSPADLAAVRAGQTISVSGPNGDTARATVIFVSPLLDPNTRAARVVASLDNSDGRWQPGAYVSAELTRERASVDVTVPPSALQVLNGGTVVFVRTEAGFSPRKVVVGRRGRRAVEITRGLAAGERIATANTFVLKAELGKSEAAHQH